MTESAADGAPAAAIPEGRGAEEIPYVHDPAAAGVAAQLVDLAYAAAERWWDLPDHLRALGPGLGLAADGRWWVSWSWPCLMTSGSIMAGRPAVCFAPESIPGGSPGRPVSPMWILM